MSTDGDEEAQIDLALVREREYADRVVKVLCVYFEHNQVPVERIGDVITAVTSGLVGGSSSQDDEVAAADGDAGDAEPQTPAVPIRKSLTDDHLVCLECGEHRTTLKLHIERRHDLSPHQYRTKWSLDDDYPMTAPAYSRKRSAQSKELGLGRKKDDD